MQTKHNFLLWAQTTFLFWNNFVISVFTNQLPTRVQMNNFSRSILMHSENVFVARKEVRRRISGPVGNYNVRVIKRTAFFSSSKNTSLRYRSRVFCWSAVNVSPVSRTVLTWGSQSRSTIKNPFETNCRQKSAAIKNQFHEYGWWLLTRLSSKVAFAI